MIIKECYEKIAVWEKQIKVGNGHSLRYSEWVTANAFPQCTSYDCCPYQVLTITIDFEIVALSLPTLESASQQTS